MNSLEKALSTDEEYLRLKALTAYFRENSVLKDKMKALTSLQKRLVAAKVEQDFNKTTQLELEYQDLKKELLTEPFVEEYFTLLEDFYNALSSLKLQIEEKIEKKLNLE